MTAFVWVLTTPDDGKVLLLLRSLTQADALVASHAASMDIDSNEEVDKDVRKVVALGWGTKYLFYLQSALN